MMCKKLLISSLVPLLMATFSAQSLAVQAGDLIKECSQQQVAAHKGLQGLKKSLTESEFQPYCSCVAKTIEESATQSQMDELKSMGIGRKPKWFLGIQKSAEQKCLSGEPKAST